MNRVEAFEAETLFELEDVINAWCKKTNIEPLNVSVGYNPTANYPYFAVVVVKEL